MDVWFDSGTSWTLLPEQETKPVADVYLEGTDQHRGWFQSSLLTHVAAQNRGMADVQAPYKTLITHGFTLDSKGRKMSKSLGNVVSPAQIISGELAGTQKKKRKGRNGEESQNDGLGSDALRLWAASSDYTKDVSIGQAQLFSVEQALRKYRVTLKWLLGILSLPTCPPPYSSLNTVRAELQESSSKLSLLADTIALRRLFEVSEEVHGHYAKYEFYKGVKVINNFLAKDLSAFYFETLKDRVYTGPKADCQTLQHVLGVIYYELLHMLAPVCPLLVEEAWDHLPDTLKENSVHPMRNTWQPLRPVGPKSVVAKDDPHSKMILSDWDEYIHKIGQAVNTATERLRANGHIGSSLEARVIVEVVDCQDPWGLEKFLADTSFGQDHRFNELTGLFVVSEFEVRDHAWFGIAKAEMHMKEKPFEYQEVKWGEGEDIQNYAHARIMVTKSDLAKCPRCWRLVVEKPVSDKVVQAEEERLCERCEEVVKEEGVQAAS
jgi:isoleucyl-tRNA synthetase